VDRLFQGTALREVPAAAPAVQRGHQARQGTKGSTDTGTAEHLLAKIDEIDKIFRETKS